MTYQFLYGAVRENPRKVIHAVRLVDVLLDEVGMEALAETVRERIRDKTGEQYAAIVIVQGHDKSTLRLVGESYAVLKVREAMFNAAIRWRGFTLD
jgi:hypothetical protein